MANRQRSICGTHAPRRAWRAGYWRVFAVTAQILSLSISAVSSTVVGAQTPHPPTVEGNSEATVVAPVALDTLTPYPAAVHGSDVVVLELLVTAEGKVLEPRVLQGKAVFRRAALAALPSWRFAPATRNGQAVAARIRFLIEFSEPAEGPAQSSVAKAQSPASVGRAATPSLVPSAESIEVLVRGQIVPGASSLGRAEVRVLPGAFGDPFRAISMLPGVAPLVTGLPVSYVRGSPPGNIGFAVDGIRLPMLFHAFLGPSVIHPRLLDAVTMHAGGYPAQVGRYAGAIINADLAQPQSAFVAEASIRLVDAGAFVETPFANGRGRLVLAGRYSYTALLLSLLGNVDLRYWDYQALVSYELSPDDTLSMLALGALDYAGQISGGPGSPGPGGASQAAEPGAANEVSFHRLDIRYERAFGENTRAKFAVTLGQDTTQGSKGSVTDAISGLRLEVRSQLSPSILLRAGASSLRDEFELNLESDSAGLLDVLTLFPSRTDSVWGTHADLVVQLAPGLEWIPGLRLDRYRSGENRQWAISPRMALRTEVSKNLSVEHAVGLAHQPPNYVPSIPGVAVAGLPGGLQRSLQTSAGVLGQLQESLEGRATLFYNATFALTDPFSLNQDLALDSQEAAIRSLGRSYGLELSLQRRFFGGFGGMLAYTLSRSLRSYGPVNSLSGYDRPHVLNLALTQALGAGWLASSRALLYSGIPGSRRAGGTTKIFDQSRARPFFRLDARLEKRFVFGPRVSWTVVAEVLNASLSREVLRRDCNPDCRDEVVGPIFLPSLGVEGRF